MKSPQRIELALLLIVLYFTRTLNAGEPLVVVNSNFSNVPVQCGRGYAYQSFLGQTCSSVEPAQQLDGSTGIGWFFSPHVPTSGTAQAPGAGLTRPGTAFNPPSFSGLPFTQAAFLQDADSLVSQTISGFVADRLYRLSFYLGSRYGDGDGNQTIATYIDDDLVGSFSLESFTPFTIQNVVFTVTASGPHTLKFVGVASGDKTAFLSGVSIRTVGAADTE